MTEYLKQNWQYFAIATAISVLISYGIGLDDYVRSLSIVLPISWGVCAFLLKKNSPDLESQEIIKTQDLIIAEHSLKDEEQRKVILDYEDIFDSLLVELPCVCGGNTFQGLFSPNTDNVVQCEKCKQYYKVDINYNTVLVSEPLNIEQTFDELVGKNVN
jgi:hypothetical protein